MLLPLLLHGSAAKEILVARNGNASARHDLASALASLKKPWSSVYHTARMSRLQVRDAISGNRVRTSVRLTMRFVTRRVAVDTVGCITVVE